MTKINLKKIKMPVSLEFLGISELNYLDEKIYGPSDLVPVELANHLLQMAPKYEDRLGMAFAIRHTIATRSIPPAKKPWGQRGFAKKTNA